MKTNIKRLIVEINQKDKSFDISTPDGTVEYKVLFDIISTILHILEENKPVRKKRISKKELN